MKEIVKKLSDWKFIILIILIIGGAFYWFQLRPTQIRKKCYQVAESPKDYFVQGSVASKYTEKAFFDDISYSKCLLENGLNK